jgi:hypothetical protein
MTLKKKGRLAQNLWKNKLAKKKLPLFEARQAQQWQQYIYIGYTDVCTKIAS